MLRLHDQSKNYIYLLKMGLQLSISVVEETDSFIVNDCTGVFSSENKGGWGSLNPQIKDIETAVLEITPPYDANPFLDISSPNPPAPNADTFQPPAYTIDVFPDFPNEEGNGFEVLPYMVGQSDNFLESGKWKIKLIITGKDKQGRPYTKSAIFEIVFVNSVTCCIDKLGSLVNKDALKDKKQQVIIELENMLESVCYAVEKELLDQADGIIRFLKEQCRCCAC